MGVNIRAEYLGDLHCRLTHGPSGKSLETDAPKDNMGKGESFSPTDLTAASLLSCMLTTMGIYAKRHGTDMAGANGEVLKEMSTEPPRRIESLTVTIRMPEGMSPEDRALYERIAGTCPVFKSLSKETQVHASFLYPD